MNEGGKERKKGGIEGGKEGGGERKKERYKGKFLTFAGVSVSKLTPGLSEVVSNYQIIHNL